MRDWTGRELRTEAARVAQGIGTRASPVSSLDFSDDVLGFPLRWNPQQFHDDLVRENGSTIFKDHADLLGATPPPSHLALHVTTLLIDKQIAFVGMPGEPFVDFQIDLRNSCPVSDCFLLGYANGYFHYFPTIRAAWESGKKSGVYRVVGWSDG